MAVTPSGYPQPPSRDLPPDDPGREPWNDYVPHHYVARPTGMSTTTKLGVAAVLAAGLGGGYYLIAEAGLSSGGIFSEVESTLGKVTCAARLGPDLQVGLLIAHDRADAYAGQADHPVASCVEEALAGLKLRSRRPSELVTAKFPVNLDSKGHPKVGEYPRKLQRLESDWVVGVLGDNVDDERGDIRDLLDDNLGELMYCYAEFSSRAHRSVPGLSWHTEDQLFVRIRLNPDGTMEQVYINRPGISERARDWTDNPDYKQCIRQVLESMRWPRHSGQTSEWVNTSFEVTPSEI